MIDLAPEYLEKVRTILREHVPQCEVRAFGSRVSWTTKDYSDLDLAVVCSGKLSDDTLNRLKESFEESDLPFRVDVLDWHATSPEFQKVIEKQYEVVQAAKNGDEPVERLVGPLPDGWEYTTLGEACSRGGGDVQTGPFGSQLHAADYVRQGIPSIMPQNIGDNRVVQEGIARITPPDAERLSRYRVRRGDIVYSRRGDVEKRALIRQQEEGWLCGTGCLRIRFGDSSINPVYASYYLGDPRVREWVVRHAHGATMPNLNTEILSDLPFVVPPVPEQHAVAHILGTLDDKIELNRRMSEKLEAMARALFKSWFVDFDPVRAKAEGRDPGLPKHTADLFPDSFEDSQLGEIPKGWHIDQIKARASRIQYGLTQSASDVPIGPRFLRITDIQRGRIDWRRVPYCAVSDEEHKKYRIMPGDIFVARTGASTGENVFVPKAPDAVFASYLVRFQFALPSIARIVAEYMRTSSYFEHVAGAIGGSAQPNASAQVLAGAPLVFPPLSIADQFAKLIQPMDQLRAEHETQSGILEAIRDTLLPKLISGELRVKGVETTEAQRLKGISQCLSASVVKRKPHG